MLALEQWNLVADGEHHDAVLGIGAIAFTDIDVYILGGIFSSVGLGQVLRLHDI